MIVPFGLHNSGSVCYFNSLIQSLLSSDVFIILLTHGLKQKKIEPNDFINNLINIVNKYFNHTLQNNNNHSSQNEYALQNNSKSVENYGIILNAILRNMVQKNGGLADFGNSQDCSLLSLSYLIDLNQLQSIFNIRYQRTIHCNNCNNDDIKMDKNNFVNMFDYNKTFLQNLAGDISQQKDYKCDKCNSKDVQITTLLKHLPPVLCIVFNKYDNYNKQCLIEYPETFNDFGIEYQLVAQVLHNGSLNGGHYFCIGKRDDNYYCFNDTSVSNVNNFKHYTNAFILIYENKIKK